MRAKTRLTAFHEHNLRYPKIIEQRVQAILSATALTSDAAVITPNRLLVEVLVEQLRSALHAVARFDHEIAQLADSLPDYTLFSALPGAGPVFAPRLLAVFGEQRERYASAAAIQKYVGIAPATERSGNQCWVHWRLQCPTFLRQTFVEWTAQSIPHSYWARASTNSNVPKDPHTRRRCARWPSSGFVSCTAAGRIGLPTTKRPTSMRLSVAGRLCSTNSARRRKRPCGTTQGVNRSFRTSDRLPQSSHSCSIEQKPFMDQHDRAAYLP